MMSAVFLMQPVGQFMAYGLGLAVLHGLAGRYNLEYSSSDLATDTSVAYGRTQIGIDKLWRIIAGVGGIPAVLALIFRCNETCLLPQKYVLTGFEPTGTIPESPRYTCDIKQDAAKALLDTANGTTNLFSGWSRAGFDDDESLDGRTIGSRSPHHSDDCVELREATVERDFASSPPVASPPPGLIGIDGNHINIRRASEALDLAHPSQSQQHQARIKEQDIHIDSLDDDTRQWSQFSSKNWNDYFHDGPEQGGNWRNIFGVAVCWGFLDFAF
jgi:hypothetical protein